MSSKLTTLDRRKKMYNSNSMVQGSVKLLYFGSFKKLHAHEISGNQPAHYKSNLRRQSTATKSIILVMVLNCCL